MTAKVDDWRALAEKELRGRPLEDLTWKTLEGIEVKPLYTPADIEGLPQIDEVPGNTWASTEPGPRHRATATASAQRCVDLARRSRIWR